MSERKIIMKISNGQSTLEAEGFHGVGCKDLIDRITAGNEVVSSENKPEFYESNLSENTVTNY